MKSNYKQTFDVVRMSSDSQEKIRAELSASLIGSQKEVNTLSNKTRYTKKLIVALAAAVVIFSLSTVIAFAYGNQIIHLFSGGQLEIESSDTGQHITVTEYADNYTDPIEIRDGRVYLLLDDSNQDITDYLSETTFYHYETISNNGNRHVFVVGGEPNDPGWVEYIFDEASSSLVIIMNNASQDNPPEWVVLANERFND